MEIRIESQVDELGIKQYKDVSVQMNPRIFVPYLSNGYMYA